MPKNVEVDMSECSLCEGCVAMCPNVFRLNDAGYIEVSEAVAPEDEECVREAVKYCPEDCITWEPEDG